MTLDKDRRQKNLRPPMRPVVFWIWIAVAAAVLVFVGVTVIVSGQSFF